MDTDQQLERDAGARRELARAAGMAIHRATGALAGGGIFDSRLSPYEIALVTFASRGRRLLHSAFRLIDVGEESEAAALLRVLHEYLIVTRWLGLDPVQHTKRWALDDLRGRAVAAEKTSEDEDLDEATRAAIAELGKESRLHFERQKADMGDEYVAPPRLEQMAKDGGLIFPYSFVYRLQSQADVHATALAIDKTIEKTGEGLRLLEKPGTGLDQFDSYQIGAHLLLDLVRPLAERWPALGWGPTLDAVEKTLTAIAHADPRSETSKQGQESD